MQPSCVRNSGQDRDKFCGEPEVAPPCKPTRRVILSAQTNWCHFQPPQCSGFPLAERNNGVAEVEAFHVGPKTLPQWPCGQLSRTMWPPRRHARRHPASPAQTTHSTSRAGPRRNPQLRAVPCDSPRTCAKSDDGGCRCRSPSSSRSAARSKSPSRTHVTSPASALESSESSPTVCRTSPAFVGASDRPAPARTRRPDEVSQP
jgi:hypothetical protein